MNAIFKTDKNFGGEISAISSKSELHRLVIASMLSGGATEITCRSDSLDVDATLACARALGMSNSLTKDKIMLSLGREAPLDELCVFRCGESGSTLRFMLPIASALGRRSAFVMEPGLARRPHGELCNLLAAHGVDVRIESGCIYTEGRLLGGEYRLPGNISSQYVTGLLFALPLAERDSHIVIDGKLMSQPYVDMTLDVVRAFGICVEPEENGYFIRGNQRYRTPGKVSAGGDWSNAATLLCMGALCEKGVACHGISRDSSQGDKAIVNYLECFGASVRVGENSTFVRSSSGIFPAELDLTDTPDLALVVGVVAAAAKGDSVILGTDRLKYKESDRRLALCNTVNSLGASAEIGDNCIIIHGNGALSAGTLPSFGDHRVVMAAATASIFSNCDTVVEGAETISKSYKSFFDDYASLGGSVTTITL